MHALRFGRTGSTCATVTCAAVLFAASIAQGGDWTRFRGENGAGVSDDAAVPTKWSATENLKWKTQLPGPGFSSPIVVGDKVFVTCYSGYGVDRQNAGRISDLKRHLVCVDRNSGKVLWDRTVDAAQPEDPYEPPGVTTHGYASHTPVSDGQRVYAFFGKSGVVAFDLDGKKLWQTAVGMESDPRRWGSAASPIVYKDLVIVNASAESSALVALDKKTGEEKWRAEAGGLASSWSTPIIAATKDGAELLVPTPAEVWSLDPQSGKLKWYSAGANSRGMASSLVVDGDVAYGIGGQMGGNSFAVRIGGKEDVSESNVLWTGRGYAQFGTPVLYKGHLFGVDESGIAYCVNVKTGERVYGARLATGEAVEESAGRGGPGRGGPGGPRRGGPGGEAQRGGPGGPGGPGAQAGRGGPRRGGMRGGGMGGRSYGSSILVNDKVYFTDQSGKTYVFAANTEKFELIATNELPEDDSGFNGTPAVSNGALFIRSNTHLYCVSSK